MGSYKNITTKMKNSKPKGDSCCSTSPSACTSPAVLSEVCQCNGRFKELDSFLSNLEIEHKRMLSQSFQKLIAGPETRGKAHANRVQAHLQYMQTSPFELCPVLHYEGIWKILRNAFLKVERSRTSGDGGNLHSLGEAKQKVNVKPKPGVKKKVKTNPGFRAVPPKNSSFQHNVPVDMMLQVYRDNNIYSKSRMRRVDKVTIMNAIYSAMNCKQVPTPAVLMESRGQVPREMCTQVVNLSFHRESLPANQESTKIHGSKESSHHKEKTLSESRMNKKRPYGFEMVVKQLFPSTGRRVNGQ